MLQTSLKCMEVKKTNYPYLLTSKKKAEMALLGKMPPNHLWWESFQTNLATISTNHNQALPIGFRSIAITNKILKFLEAENYTLRQMHAIFEPRHRWGTTKILNT